MAPMFEVYEVYDNESHPAREALLNDLGDIPQEVVEWYKNENEMKFPSTTAVRCSFFTLKKKKKN